MALCHWRTALQAEGEVSLQRLAPPELHLELGAGLRCAAVVRRHKARRCVVVLSLRAGAGAAPGQRGYLQMPGSSARALL